MGRRIERYRVKGISEYLPDLTDDVVHLRSWSAREAADMADRKDALAAQIANTICDDRGDLRYTYAQISAADPMEWDAMVVNGLVNVINAHCLGEGLTEKIEAAEKN